MQGQLHVLLFASFQMDAGEAAQSRSGAPGNFGKADIELDHFVSLALAGVLHIDLNVQRIARLQRGFDSFSPLYSKVV